MTISTHLLRSEHQKRVDKFMVFAKQDVPDAPKGPSEAVRLLRAKLIFEEALETILALGVCVRVTAKQPGDIVLGNHATCDLEFDTDAEFNLIEVIDGCCDLKVVTTGTLSACGIPDMPFQEAVDQNNLDKFGAGHSWREDGKLIKPPGHQPPDIAGVLARITA